MLITINLKNWKNVSIVYKFPAPSLNRYVFYQQIKGHNYRTEKVVKFEIELDLTFKVPDLVYKFQMISLR